MPETRVSIEMDSACRNQQVIAMMWKIVPGHFYYFLALWLNLCNNSDQTFFSNALPLPGTSGTSPEGPGKC